jgi:hypothetical protein
MVPCFIFLRELNLSQFYESIREFACHGTYYGLFNHYLQASVRCSILGNISSDQLQWIMLFLFCFICNKWRRIWQNSGYIIVSTDKLSWNSCNLQGRNNRELPLTYAIEFSYIRNSYHSPTSLVMSLLYFFCSYVNFIASRLYIEHFGMLTPRSNTRGVI